MYWSVVHFNPNTWGQELTSQWSPYIVCFALFKIFTYKDEAFYILKVNLIFFFFFTNRTQDLKTKKHHIPVVDRTPLEPPPIVVVVMGPPKVGKSTLIQCLIRNFTRQKLTEIRGPVTIVSGRRVVPQTVVASVIIWGTCMSLLNIFLTGKC